MYWFECARASLLLLRFGSACTTINLALMCSGFGHCLVTPTTCGVKKIETVKNQLSGSKLKRRDFKFSYLSQSSVYTPGSLTEPALPNPLVKVFITFHCVINWPPQHMFESLTASEYNVQPARHSLNVHETCPNPLNLFRCRVHSKDLTLGFSLLRLTSELLTHFPAYSANSTRQTVSKHKLSLHISP